MEGELSLITDLTQSGELQSSKVSSSGGQTKLVFTQKCMCIEISHLCSGYMFVKSKRQDKCISCIEVWPQISARDRNKEFVLTGFLRVRNFLSFFLTIFLNIIISLQKHIGFTHYKESLPAFLCSEPLGRLHPRHLM